MIWPFRVPAEMPPADPPDPPAPPEPTRSTISVGLRSDGLIIVNIRGRGDIRDHEFILNKSAAEFLVHEVTNAIGRIK